MCGSEIGWGLRRGVDRPRWLSSVDVVSRDKQPVCLAPCAKRRDFRSMDSSSLWQRGYTPLCTPALFGICIAECFGHWHAMPDVIAPLIELPRAWYTRPERAGRSTRPMQTVVQKIDPDKPES